MSRTFFKSKRTTFVTLDTHVCEACWKCIDVCPQNVIGRINLPWHKHATFIHSYACKGCMNCVNVCNSNAIVSMSQQTMNV